MTTVTNNFFLIFSSTLPYQRAVLFIVGLQKVLRTCNRQRRLRNEAEPFTVGQKATIAISVQLIKNQSDVYQPKSHDSL